MDDPGQRFDNYVCPFKEPVIDFIDFSLLFFFAFNITVIQIYTSTTNAKEAEVEPSRTIAKGDVLFTPGDWNVKVGSQEISGVTGKFGYEVQNEAW